MTFLALVGASLLQAAAAATVALCIQLIFDRFLLSQEPAEIASLGVLGAVLVVTMLGAASLEIARAWLGERLGLGYVSELREAMFLKLISSPQHKLSQRRQGSLLLPFVGDLTAIKRWVSDGLVRLMSATAMLTILIAVLAMQSRLLALAASAVIILSGLAVTSMSGALAGAIALARAKRSAIANFVSASIRAAATIQAFNRMEREIARLRRRNEAFTRSGLKLAVLTGGVTATVHLAGVLLVVVILTIGVIEVRAGVATAGLVAAALSLAGLLSSAIRDLGISFELWRRASVSFAKVRKTLAVDAKARTEARAPAPSGRPDLSLQHVGVSGLFTAVDAEVKEGDVVNVEGPSGAGKSSLLSLVSRLREPDEGRLCLNGRDIGAIAPSALRKRVGVASAALPLLRGSVEMNLRYRRRGASEQDLLRIVELCGLGPLLARLPGGLAARLSEGAPELSRAEAQKLQIARAVLGTPAVLVLDDVDSHLDEATAVRLVAMLKTYPGIVLMAAGSQLAGAANVTWVLEDGALRVVEAKAPRLEARAEQQTGMAAQ